MQSSTRSGGLLTIVPALVTLGLPALASAEPPSGAGKKVRIHVDSDFFGFTHVEPDDSMTDSSDSVGFGVGRTRITDSIPFGFFARPVFGLGVGGVLLRDQLVIGARGAVAVDGFDVGSDTTITVANGQLTPYVHGVFLPGKRARPYAELRFGFGGGASKFEGLDGDTTTHFIFPTVGVGGGVHIFIIDAFSIDLGLNFDYLALFGRTTSDDPMVPETDWDKSGDIISLSLLFGLSVWI